MLNRKQTRTQGIAVCFILLFLCVSAGVKAQRKWSFDFRPAAGFTTKDLGKTQLKTGVGFEGGFSYKMLPFLKAYAGWSWNHFASNQSVEGVKPEFEETGYNLGVQFSHRIKNSRLEYMVRGGGTYNHIETENGGDVTNDTGHGAGWQMGGGLVIPLTRRCSLIPEIRYRSLSRTITSGGVKTDVNLNYIATGVGISIFL